MAQASTATARPAIADLFSSSHSLAMIVERAICLFQMAGTPSPSSAHSEFSCYSYLKKMRSARFPTDCSESSLADVARKVSLE